MYVVVNSIAVCSVVGLLIESWICKHFVMLFSGTQQELASHERVCMTREQNVNHRRRNWNGKLLIFQLWVSTIATSRNTKLIQMLSAFSVVSHRDGHKSLPAKLNPLPPKPP